MEETIYLHNSLHWVFHKVRAVIASRKNSCKNTRLNNEKKNSIAAYAVEKSAQHFHKTTFYVNTNHTGETFFIINNCFESYGKLEIWSEPGLILKKFSTLVDKKIKGSSINWVLPQLNMPDSQRPWQLQLWFKKT